MSVTPPARSWNHRPRGCPLGLPAGRVGYFFAHVESNRKGFTRRPPARVPITVMLTDFDRMLTYPRPTDIIGIDERPGHERAYIASASRPWMGWIQDLPPMFPLDAASMNVLWKEVEGYWSDRNIVMNHSIFDL
jgi:hypothetical protein